VGGDEHDNRRTLQRGQQIEAIAAAEFDVEEHELRLGLLDRRQSIGNTLSLADDLDLGMAGQQAAQRLAR
jgi:hypothetical protein